jgi:uncharacterized membrane protein
MNAVLQILALGTLLLVMDLPWLYATNKYTTKMIADIQKTPLKLRYDAAVVVYVALGYLLTRMRSWKDAALSGAAVYAVYDFTNLSTITNYDPMFAVADSLWGGTLMGSAYLAANYLKLL